MDDNLEIGQVSKPRALIGIRHLQYLLMFSGAVVVYGMRTVLNVAIVAMLSEDDDVERNYPVYPEWKDQKNVMLSCFSWGHIWFQILAGQLAKNYGPKYYLTAAIVISSVCILVIPWFAATVGYKGIIAVRVIEGAFHGVLFPSVHFLLSKWVPVWERAKWGSFVYAGQVLGNCLAMPITGVLCDTKSGWPLAFYFYGGLGLTWSLLWLLLGSNTPSSDARISSEERSWIESGTVIAETERPPTPWRAIFTSVPFIAIIITHCGQNWGFWTLLTEIPSFMKQILKYKNTSTGFISALPYLVMWLMNLWWSPIADYIIQKKYVTLIASRKIFNSIGLFIPAIALISITFIESTNKEVIITILVITVAFNAGHYCGFNINHMDISPTYAGILMGISNSFSAIFTMLAPLAVDLVKYITGYEELLQTADLAYARVILKMNLRKIWFQKSKRDETEKGPLFGCRHVQMIFYFFLMTFTYCMRSVLSVAIVAMTDPKTTANKEIEVYHWDNQSVVLSAFFWGYVLLQVPSAQLGKKIGAKWMLVACTTLDSISCISIPIMASHFGATGVMVCRVFQGLAQGGVAPLLHTMLGCWAPPSERSVMGTVAYVGSTFGNILCLPLTGVICSGHWGWPASFYLFGLLGLTWALAWTIFGANSPSTHKSISHVERKYIETSLGQIEKKVHHTPWRAILKSPPFWAVTFAFIGANWGSSVLLTQTPTYLNKILKYDIKSNSLLSAAPYLAMMACSLTFSPICDKLINSKIVSRGTARKLFNSIGMVFPAVSLTLVGFIPKDKAPLSVALLILTGGLSAGGFCGFQVNHVDLSPNHSGIMMGITNSSTSIFSIISPLIVQFIVSGDQTDQSQWRTIFIITACVYLAADLFFIIFASGEIQPWNDITEGDTNPDKAQQETPSQRNEVC